MKTPAKTMPQPLFNAKTVTREELVAWIIYWWPAGSGPLSMMRIIVASIAQIAELREFDPITDADLNLSYEDARVILQKNGFLPS